MDPVTGHAQRILIVGRTQSGKTTLARTLIGGYSSLVVIDPKRRVTPEQLGGRAVVIEADPGLFGQTWPQRARRVIYRPDPNSDRAADVGLVIRRVLRYGRTALVVDEAMELCTQGWIQPDYKVAITQGAELLVPVYSLTQRPIGVHNILLTEAEHFFVFDLPGSSDRRKMAEFVGDGADARPEQRYGFLYAGTATDGAVVPCPPLELTPDPSPATSNIDTEAARDDPIHDRQPGVGHGAGGGRDRAPESDPEPVPRARAL